MHVFGSVMAGIPRLPLFRIVLCRNIHSAQPAAAMIPPASAYPAPVRIAPFPPCRNNTSPSQATCSVSPFANSTSTVSPRRLCSSRRAYSCASQSSTYAPLSARRRQSASLPSASAKAYTSSSTPVIVAFALSMGCRASVTASMSSLAAIIKHAASRNPIKNTPSDPGERSASRRSSVMPRNPAANFPNRMAFPFPAFDSLTQLPETALAMVRRLIHPMTACHERDRSERWRPIPSSNISLFVPQFFNGVYWNALPHISACSLRRGRQMNRALNMRPAPTHHVFYPMFARH